MYEPIIDPMIFYWMDILEKVRDLPPALLFVGILGAVLLVLICAFMDCTDKQAGKYIGSWGL